MRLFILVITVLHIIPVYAQITAGQYAHSVSPVIQLQAFNSGAYTFSDTMSIYNNGTDDFEFSVGSHAMMFFVMAQGLEC